MDDRRVSMNPGMSALVATTTERLLAGETRIAVTWALVRAAQKRLERRPRTRPRHLDAWVPRHA